jgi:hemolysin III
MLLCLKCLNENIFLIGLTEGQFICFVEWILIFIGITFKSIWIKKFKWLHIAIFLLLGWSAMLFIGDLYNNTNEVFLLLILFGGISYTIGVIFYGFQKIPYFHFVWHIFVCIGSILHTIALLIEIYI